MNQHVVNCAVPTSVIIIRDVTKDYSKGCYFKYRCKGILYLGGPSYPVDLPLPTILWFPGSNPNSH